MELGFEDLVRKVERTSEDPLGQLRAAAEKSREISAMGETLLDHFVEKGRAAGLTWAQIGEALNVSKQAAQQRSARFVQGVTSAVGLAADEAQSRLRAAFSKGPTFHRFTDMARTAIVEAQQAALDIGTGEVGTEHLLLGIFRVDRVGAKALVACGLTADAAAAAIDDLGGARSTGVFGAGFDKPAKKALELSLREALKLGHNYIGTEHLALALLQGDGDTAARRILDRAGVTYAALRDEVVRLLAEMQAGRGKGRGAGEA